MSEKLRVRFEGVIARPIADVFLAIVDDEQMAKYFFTRSSGPIEEGRILTWHFDDADAHLPVTVMRVEKDRRIVFRWSASGKDTEVEMLFDEVPGGTRVRIDESSFSSEKKGPLRAMGQMSGWTDFFDSLKAYLLFGVDLRRGTGPAPKPAAPIPVIPPEIPVATPLRDVALAVAGIVLGLILGAGAMYFYLTRAAIPSDSSLLPSSIATTSTSTAF